MFRLWYICSAYLVTLCLFSFTTVRKSYGSDLDFRLYHLKFIGCFKDAQSRHDRDRIQNASRKVRSELFQQTYVCMLNPYKMSFSLRKKQHMLGSCGFNIKTVFENNKIKTRLHRKKDFSNLGSIRGKSLLLRSFKVE